MPLQEDSDVEVEQNMDLPEYLPEDESPAQEQHKAVSRLGSMQDGMGWLSTAANFLSRSFYWWPRAITHRTECRNTTAGCCKLTQVLLKLMLAPTPQETPSHRTTKTAFSMSISSVASLSLPQLLPSARKCFFKDGLVQFLLLMGPCVIPNSIGYLCGVFLFKFFLGHSVLCQVA